MNADFTKTSQFLAVRLVPITRVAVLACVTFGFPALVCAQAFVPGAGQRLEKVGDDFEDENWFYNLNGPKSNKEHDKQERLPAGGARNGRWGEGLLRGQPDVVKRVPTPEGGIPGSTGSMLMASQHTGHPTRFSGKTSQDDLIAIVDRRLGGAIPASWEPSVVVRVWLPPWEDWERRTGNSFCFRASCQTHVVDKKGGGLFASSSSKRKSETYWPGMLIHFNPGNGATKQDSATLLIRAGRSGADLRALEIKEPGWWTLGMSFTRDGQVHYFAHAGVEDLTMQDHLTSQFPYGYRCEQFNTFFFDVLSGDNGNWSTPWIVDDAFVYARRVR